MGPEIKIPKSQKEHMEQTLAHVEHDRSRPVLHDDVVRITIALESEDANVRADALPQSARTKNRRSHRGGYPSRSRARGSA